MNKKPAFVDPTVYVAVKGYLEAKVSDNFLDMDDMTRFLHKAQFPTTPYNNFKVLVETAYDKIAAESYVPRENESDTDESDGSDLEVLSNHPKNPVSDMMATLYQHNASKQSVVNISSDEDDDEAIPLNRNTNAAKKATSTTSTSNTKPSSSNNNNNNNVMGACVVTKVSTAGANVVTSSRESLTLKRSELLPPEVQNSAKKQKVDSSSSSSNNAYSQAVQNRAQPQTPLQQQQQPKQQLHHFETSQRNSRDNGIASNRAKQGRGVGSGAVPPHVRPRSDYDIMQAGSQSRPQNRPRRYKLDVSCCESGQSFRDIGGMEKTLKELCEVLLHIKSPTIYHVLGLSPPRGILLHGPPGCGKTLLAHAIAGQLQLSIIEITATEFIAGVSGESEERIRDVFDQACRSQPCVLFIDEIDAISGNRNFAQKDMERRVVSQLISCMDALHQKESGQSVLVIGATTRPDVLDPGLRRVGRFDHEIAIGIPTRRDRVQILEILCEGLSLQENFDFEKIAELTPGYVGADLLALVSRAATIAVKRRCTEQMHAYRTQAQKDIPIVDLDDDGDGDIDMVEIDSEKGEPVDGTKKKIEANNSRVELNNEKVDQTNKEAAAHKDVEENKEVESTKKDDETNKQVEPTKEAAETTDKLVESTNKEVETSNEKVETSTTEAVKANGEKGKDKAETSAMEVDHAAEGVADKETKGKGDDLAEKTTNANPTKEGDETAEVTSSEAANVDIVTISPTKNSEENSEKSSTKTAHIREPTLRELLFWLDNPPEEFSSCFDLTFTIADFEAAVKVVQPSAKREGFITVPDVTWDDVGSLGDVRDELKLAVLAPVKHPEMLERLGLTAPSGVLLCGPPGCGKTLLAKAIANEAGINFISVKGPELMNMYVGESERAVRACFQRARNSAPCVIFFDEFDSLCPKRSDGNDSGSGTRIVNQLLTEMDGVDERKGVYVLAATNRPDIIDPAILRPGRLDTILYVGMPKENDRLEILKATTKNGTKPVLASDVNLQVLAFKTDGYTGADLAGLVRQSAMLALKDALDADSKGADLFVRMDHFEAALKMLRPSVNSQDRKIYEKLRIKYAAPREPNKDVEE